jgi:hypothetical protein
MRIVAQVHETLYTIAEMNKTVAGVYGEVDRHFRAVHDHMAELVDRLASLPVCILWAGRRV